MLIADTRSVLQDRTQFTARGAGILGMAPFGRDHLYLLDASEEERGAWLAKHAGEPVLVFGFTFMVWQHLPGGADLRGGILIHSGGWKALADQAVTPEEFRRVVAARTGIERVHNFYGMAEQTGTVYVECEAGALHAPATGDVVVRDPATWAPAPRGEQGVVEVVSTLPESYPGHALLTEDLGRVVRGRRLPVRAAGPGDRARRTGAQGGAARVQRHGGGGVDRDEGRDARPPPRGGRAGGDRRGPGGGPERAAVRRGARRVLPRRLPRPVRGPAGQAPSRARAARVVPAARVGGGAGGTSSPPRRARTSSRSHAAWRSTSRPRASTRCSSTRSPSPCWPATATSCASRRGARRRPRCSSTR